MDVRTDAQELNGLMSVQMDDWRRLCGWINRCWMIGGRWLVCWVDGLVDGCIVGLIDELDGRINVCVVG